LAHQPCVSGPTRRDLHRPTMCITNCPIEPHMAHANRPPSQHRLRLRADHCPYLGEGGGAEPSARRLPLLATDRAFASSNRPREIVAIGEERCANSADNLVAHRRRPPPPWPRLRRAPPPCPGARGRPRPPPVESGSVGSPASLARCRSACRVPFRSFATN